MLRKTGFVLMWVFIAFNFFWGFLGVASIFLTLSFYLLLGFCLLKGIAALPVESGKKVNYRVFVITLLAGLFLVELLLAFGFKYGLTYRERNGSFFNSSPYRQNRMDYFNRKYIVKQKDCQLRIHQPGTSTWLKRPEYEYEHKFNALGLRGDEPSKNNGIYNIVSLGDSFTEGEGTPADSTWPVLLEKELSKTNTSEKIRCINAGCSGSDPFYEYILLERELLKYKPKMVIVSINQSDIYDVITRGGMERFKPDGSMAYVKGPWWEFFYQFSYIFRNVAHSLFHINMQLMTDEHYSSEVQKATEKIRRVIQENFKRLSTQKHFKLVVILHPMQYELDQQAFNLEPLWEAFRTDSTFTTVNLYNEMREKKKAMGYTYSSLYWHTDMHHNSKGYKLWADLLTGHLRDTRPYPFKP